MTRPWWQWLLGWLAFAVFLATLVFYVSSGLVAPAWAIGVLLLVWLALLATAIVMMQRRKPLWVLVIPVLAFLIWWAALTAGEKWLGWTP
jgi:hypothetical protein